MAKNEEVLEKLYELLTLYFSFTDSVPTGFIKCSDNMKSVEPALDSVVARDYILARITSLIIADFKCDSKGE